MIIYLLKVNISVALFYIFYRVFFTDDTFFRWRRATLLGAITLSLIIPLVSLNTFANFTPANSPMAAIYASNILPALTVTPETGTTKLGNEIDIAGLLPYIYIVVTAILLARLSYQIWAIYLLTRRTPKTTLNGVEIYDLKEKGNPFSFINWIFINTSQTDKDHLDDIILHEQAHVRQHHSADVFLCELFCILNWFNPFAWLMKRQVKINLEYLADEHVVSRGINSKQYQYHLLAIAYSNMKNFEISNNFNVLPLKKRIKMMNRKRTTPKGKTKYLMFLPLVAMLLVASNAESVTRIYSNSDKIAIMNKDGNAGDNDDKVYDICEEFPKFPGGEEELWKFLATNLKYPEIAIKGQIEGRSLVQFIVNKDGSISDIKTIKPSGSEETPEGLVQVIALKRNGNEITDIPAVRKKDCYDALDAEAIRVVKLLTKWNPGKNNGKPIRVKYTLPVQFRLQ